VHDRARVLVETETDQRRRLGDGAQQTPEPRALLEVLVDDRAFDEAEPGGGLHVAVTRSRSRLAERHHVRGERARSCRRAGDHGSPVLGEMQRVMEPGTRHDRREPELIAAREEDRRGIGQLAHGIRAVGFRAILGPHPGDASDTELEEQRLVELQRLLADLRRGRDHGDARLRSPRELHEPLEDLPAAELVLGATDQHDRARATGSGRKLRCTTGS
jgi:hypothetical protein